MIGMAIIKVLGHSLLTMVIGLFFMGVSRKVTARMHRRIGPPVWQAYIDVIKAFSRKSISYNYVMDFGSWMGLAGLLAAAMFIPLAGFLPVDSSGPLVLILYLMPIGYLGMALEVAATGNPLSTIGIARALTLLVGYEVPFIIIVLGMISRFGSTSLVLLQQVQQGGFFHWNMVTMPIGFVAALIAFQAMLAKKPFDTMIAPSEIASGPMVELSGKFLGLAFLQYSVAVYVETALITLLFLGGGNNAFEFILKQLILYVLATIVSDMWGRFKVEQAVKFLWIYAGGLALIQLLINMYL